MLPLRVLYRTNIYQSIIKNYQLTFKDFKMNPQLMEGLDAMGFREPTPIQERAIPLILEGHDVIACAQTGTGKTAAFILPVINNILNRSTKGINTLVLAPTRELAMQIDQQIEGFSYFTNSSSIAVYGGGDGQAWTQQKRALKKGADIVIATPGRLISFLGSDSVSFENLQHLILDEADRMLDMGFFDDIMKIIDKLPKSRQTLLFSATMPRDIRKLASGIMGDYKEVSISISKPAEGILQQAYMTHDSQKESLLRKILSGAEEYSSVIVFASTKEKVKNLYRNLKKLGEEVKDFHSDLDQRERELIMNQFKGKKIRILIGTDILSRGIDVEGIDLIVNYDVPPDPEDYVHRVGRTARASSTGTAITFINEKDVKRFRDIEKLIEKSVPKLNLPSELGSGPDYSSRRGSRNSGRKGNSRNYSRSKNSNSSNKSNKNRSRSKKRDHSSGRGKHN